MQQNMPTPITDSQKCPSCRIQAARPEQYNELVTLWESSVRASHDFLLQQDIDALRPLVRERYLPALCVHICCDATGSITGFMGTQGDRLEMLFVAPLQRGRGVGRALLRYAVQNLKVTSLDVNEQNAQACAFYQSMGFSVTGRSPLDGEGRPYPLLHMQLRQQATRPLVDL